MVKSKWIRIDNKMYYFSAKGDMFKNRWVGKFYFYKDGSAARNAWVGKRYVGSAYKYLTGLQKVGGALYYFDPDTGNKIVSTTKKISLCVRRGRKRKSEGCGIRHGGGFLLYGSGGFR